MVEKGNKKSSQRFYLQMVFWFTAVQAIGAKTHKVYKIYKVRQPCGHFVYSPPANSISLFYLQFLLQIRNLWFTIHRYLFIVNSDPAVSPASTVKFSAAA